MNTSSRDFKLGFNDAFEGQPVNFDGIEDRAEYMRGYNDELDQEALLSAGSNDHA